jgi:hypothetical protein
MSNVDDGVLNNEKSIRANHSPAASYSDSPPTVTRWAYGPRYLECKEG